MRLKNAVLWCNQYSGKIWIRGAKLKKWRKPWNLHRIIRCWSNFGKIGLNPKKYLTLLQSMNRGKHVHVVLWVNWVLGKGFCVSKIPHGYGDFFLVELPLFVCLGFPLPWHQEHTQVVCSNWEARKRPARRHSRNGPWTHECCFEVMYLCVGNVFRMWNVVLKSCNCMLVVDVGIVIICIIIIICMLCFVLFCVLCVCIVFFVLFPPLCFFFVFFFEFYWTCMWVEIDVLWRSGKQEHGLWPYPFSILFDALFVCLFVFCYKTLKSLHRLPFWARSKHSGSISARAT